MHFCEDIRGEDWQKWIAQGDVSGPMFCSKQVDTFGQECLEKSKHTCTLRVIFLWTVPTPLVHYGLVAQTKLCI